MPYFHLLRAGSLAVFATLLPAQFIVDANNGAGAHFTDLVTAINSVPDGATLLVRPGDYIITSPTTVNKGLSIVGLGAVNVTQFAALSFGPTTPSQTVRLVQLTLISGSQQWYRFTQMRGPVLLDDIQCASPAIQSGLAFTDCDQVHAQRVGLPAPGLTTANFAEPRLRFERTRGSLRNCAVYGGHLAGDAVHVVDSDVAMHGSHIDGTSGLSCFRNTTTAGGHGLASTRARVLLVGTYVRGGDGGTRCSSSARERDGYAISSDTASSFRVEAGILVSRNLSPILGTPTVLWRPGSTPPYTEFASGVLDLFSAPGASAALLLGLSPTLTTVSAAIGDLHTVPMAVLGPVTVSTGRWSVPITLPPSALRATVFAQHVVFDGTDLWLPAANQLLLP